MTVHALPSVLDTAAAAPLRQELLARIDSRQPVLLDGADVTRVGQACVQVLASAHMTAVADGLAFEVRAPSGALRDMLSLARLSGVLG